MTATAPAAPRLSAQDLAFFNAQHDLPETPRGDISADATKNVFGAKGPANDGPTQKFTGGKLGL